MKTESKKRKDNRCTTVPWRENCTRNGKLNEEKCIRKIQNIISETTQSEGNTLTSVVVVANAVLNI